jgi:hypothetical protein
MFKQAARIETSILRPVPLWPEWPERPSRRFLLCVALLLCGLVSGVLGLAGAFKPGRSLDIGPLAVMVGTAPAGPLEFIGQSASAMRSRFGTPTLIRREPPAEVWQYRHDNCVLDLFLYGENAPDTVQHAEVRAAEPGPELAEDFASRCLFALQVAGQP